MDPGADIAVNVRDCSCCGGTHHGLVFRPLAVPVHDASHQATCPATGKPLLLRYRVEKVGLLFDDERG